MKTIDLIPYTGDFSDPVFARVAALYEEAFPANERRPLWNLQGNLVSGASVLWLVTEGSECCGFVVAWELEVFEFLEYLAVEPAMRGGGIGSAVMRGLRERASGKPILFEVERPEAGPHAASRIGFYRRAGFEVVDSEYYQPAYGPHGVERHGIPMYLMSDAPAPAEAAETLYTKVYGLVPEV